MRRRVLLLALLLAGCVGIEGQHVGGRPYDVAEASAFGTLREAEALGDGAWRVVMDAEFVACERNATRWEAARVLLPQRNLTPGERVGLQADLGLNALGYWPDLASYARACRERHAHDVLRAPLREEDPPRGEATAVRLRGAPLALGERTDATLRLASRQDEALAVRLENLSVHNEGAWNAAGWTGRLAPLCAVEPAAGEVVVPPGGTAGLAVVVDCPADADPRAPYPECPYAFGADDARVVSGDCHEARPVSPLAVVVGRMTFTDELGLAHAHEGVLWQFFELGNRTRLAVEAPAVVRAPHEFVLRARYTDAQGRPVPLGHVYATLMVPGIVDHAFSLDREGDAHVFRWDTMQEWTPRRWPSGEHDVVLEASDEHARYLTAAWRATVRFE